MVIVGAGECGGRAALALREEGFAGPVTLIGAESHPPYERPPLSKEAMTGEHAPMPKTVASLEGFEAQGIAFLAASPAAAIDRAEKTVRLRDGSAIAYDRLLLATGATPRRLALAGAGPRIAYLRTFEDALVIRRALGPGSRVAIIGGGFIGLELAAAGRLRGADVTLIEMQPRILMRGVPAEIAAVLHAEHERHGVGIICGDRISAIEDSGEAIRITLGDGRVVEADLAIVGIGAAPQTALAEQAGLALDNGIATDERLRTSDPDIFAAGDCCSFPLALYGGRRVRLEAWRNALEQGALAAKNMLGAEAAHAAVPWFWSDQYELGLQIAGLPDEGHETVRRDLGKDAFILFHLARDGRLVAASGIGPGTAVARDIRLAEMLIAKAARPEPAGLQSPAMKLKALLTA